VVNEERDRPLRKEAAKRAEWRGTDSGSPTPQAEGHTLPASEDNDEAMKADGGIAQQKISPPD
jgi:hypothetical protein